MSDQYVYDMDKVKKLLEAHLTGGLVASDRAKPDADMPKAKRFDPRAAADPMTEAADVQKAWRKANLTHQQRVVIYNRLAGAFYNELARHYGIDQETVPKIEEAGYAELLSYLNGGPRG